MLSFITDNDEIVNFKTEIFSLNEKHLIISESMIELLEFRNPSINFRGLEKVNSYFLAKMSDIIDCPEFPINNIITILKDYSIDIHNINYKYLNTL